MSSTDIQRRLGLSVPTSENKAIWGLIIGGLSLLLLCKMHMTRRIFRPSLLLRRISRRLLNRARAWVYLFNGPSMIQVAYDKAEGMPFEIHTPDNRCVFISSPQHIKEVDATPDTVLSMQTAARHMLQPQYTMHEFHWFDKRGSEGMGFVRTIRTLLTNGLPEILPHLGMLNSARFDELYSTCPTVNGRRQTSVYHAILKLVVLSNAVSFFGKDFANDEQFLKSALAVIEETLLCAEIVRVVPKFLAPLVGGLISRYYIKSHKVVFNTLMPIAEERVRERELAVLGQRVPKHADCISWLIETAPRQAPWTAKRVVYELMAIWFGSVHAVATTVTFALEDLCLRPEYIEPLRKELARGYDEFERTSLGLPLLDSFIRESARLSPIETMGARRQALQPFILSDGTRLAVGDWVCTPLLAIVTDARHYPDPLCFNGFRFADPKLLKEISVVKNSNFLRSKPARLTDAGSTWHVWGLGRILCPGRYYAAAVMKVILGQIIMNYDFELVDKGASRAWTWRSSMLPKSTTMMTIVPLKA